MRKTQFAELGFRNDGRGLWRIYDITDTARPAAVGPHYPSKDVLLADLYRFGTVYGCALSLELAAGPFPITDDCPATEEGERT